MVTTARGIIVVDTATGAWSRLEDDAAFFSELMVGADIPETKLNEKEFAQMFPGRVRPVSPPPPPTQCSVCKQASTSLCGRCRAVAYCSVPCQRADWRDHKKHCFVKQWILK